MIQYRCPRCQQQYQVPVEEGGQKVNCSTCGQRLQIPFPPRNRTILASLVENQQPVSTGGHLGDRATLPPVYEAVLVEDNPPTVEPKRTMFEPRHDAVDSLSSTPPRARRTLWNSFPTWFWMLCSMMGCCLMVGILLTVVGSDVKSRDMTAIGLALVVLCLLGGLGIVVIVVIGFSYSCPDCGRPWAREFLAEELVDTKKCYGLVTRYGSSYTSGTSSGQGGGQSWSGQYSGTGSSSWEERVPVIRYLLHDHYECKYCKATWFTERVEEEEDFEIDRGP